MDMHDLNLPNLIDIFSLIVLTLLMVWVIVSDTVRYIIPNTLNIAIILLFALAAFFLPIDPLASLAAAGLVLLVGLAFFALGLMGGGDVKLLFALTLWTGWSQATVNFLVMTAVAGGILVILVLLLRFIVPPIMFRANPIRPIPRLLTRKQPVPYGIAIAAAFLFLLWNQGVPVLA